jgi:hypothetical protein
MECITTGLFMALAALIWLAIKPLVVAAGWRRLADDLNLDYTPAKGFLGIPKPGHIKGNYRGRKVQISLAVETAPYSDGTYQYRYIQIALGLKKRSRRRLVVQKRWHTQLTEPGEGVPLPDRRFSDRYAITVSDPQDLAMKVFHDDGLRQSFQASIGPRGMFYLNLQGRNLYFSTRATNWFLPNSGIEWRAGVLRAILDTLVDVVEAAEAAPTVPWSMQHLHEEPEVREHPTLGAPQAAYTIRSHGTRLSGAVILALALVLFLLSISIMTTRAPTPGLICMGASLPLILMGVLASRKGMERIVVFERGLTHRVGRRMQVYAWEDIKHVWGRWVRGALKPRYTLERIDGRKLKLSSKVANDEQLMTFVQEGTHDAQIQELLSDHRGGKSIAFGPISIEGESLICGDQRFALDEIKALPVDVKGFLSVNIRKESVSLGKVKVNQVPDLHVLNGLLTELQGEWSAMSARVAEAECADFVEAYAGDRRFAIVEEGLEQLLEDIASRFLIFTEPNSGDFIQFLKLGDQAVMFDLPLANLDAETFHRASSFFHGILTSSPVLPTRDGSYQVDFTADAQGILEASGLGVAVLDQVFLLSQECSLEVKSGKS